MSDQNLIENYGYVPFYLFQYVILGLQFYMIYNYKYVNEYINETSISYYY
jgi:hypothetical protein